LLAREVGGSSVSEVSGAEAHGQRRVVGV
jgi:hypothetical protein